MISSTSNAQIKNIIQLQKKTKVRREQGTFVIEGTKMFEEAKELRLVQKAYVSNHFYEEITGKDSDYFSGIDYEIVTESIYQEISETVTPQGILALISMPSYELEQLLDIQNVNLLLLEDVRDPGNLGTIIRTAEGAGVTGIILSRGSVDLFNPKVIRSTMGSIFRIPFFYTQDFNMTLLQIKERGIGLFATHLSGEKSYTEENYSGKIGIIVGNEANGITEEVVNIADALVKIPMEGRVESLNAAVAAAIMMYEAHRQRILI